MRPTGSAYTVCPARLYNDTVGTNFVSRIKRGRDETYR